VFVGMANVILPMAQGAPREPDRARRREPLLGVVPAACLAALVLLLGLYVPSVLRHAVAEAARGLG